MGMESFNAIPEEPVLPAESERIDDVEKARVMAGAENQPREDATLLNNAQELPISEIDGLGRKFVHLDSALDNYVGKDSLGFSKGETDEEIRSQLAERSNSYVEKAEKRGEEAGEKYDKEQNK